MRRIVVVIGELLVLALTVPVLAQQSTLYRIGDSIFNAGGHAQLASGNLRITLVSIGEGTLGGTLQSTAYSSDGGFCFAYPPPGEVHGLGFTDPQTLVWISERSAGDYNLYRDAVSSLAFLAYGACEQQNLASPTATDSDPVSAGSGFYYLVTVENRLGEEGSKGTNSSGSIRQGTVCP